MSQFTISRTSNAFFQWLTAGAFALLLLVATAVPAQAQMDDGELPEIDFAVNLMQSAQALTVDDTNPPAANAGVSSGSYSGFHQVRAGLNASVQFSENVSGLVMFEAEPNDFGQNGFSPAVDFVTLDLQLTDELTLRTGTPVTGLINFRGFSDGPAVQGNPLIGNSPADMITAAHGVKLIGGFEDVGFDLTVNRSFAEDFTTSDYTGVNFIGKVRFTGSETVQVGAGGAFHTGDGVPPNSPEVEDGQNGIVFANGDRENYNLIGGGATASTHTHVNMPSGTILQGDAKITPGPADFDAWLGYATDDEDEVGTVNQSAFFGGLGAKLDLSEDFYLAGRFTYIGNTSEDAPDDHTAVNRVQLGFGYEVYEMALLKVEGVRQVEGENSYGQVGNNWSGVSTELSFSF
ncbi:hypothetical protein [Salinibacter sp.]|uniref:hypothetical protein n=1 Tax=Salinibacter sp. TaxID=2065818 RepID=UPI0021E93982|nr:hypothetical protein [Salinibacter sp.]